MDRVAARRVLAAGLVVGLAVGPIAGCASPAEPLGAPSTTLGSPTPGSPTPGSPAPGAIVAQTDELPHDPMYGQRTLTGTVERTGSCTVLLAEVRRWPITGVIADSLAVGGRFTVQGHLTPTPPSCEGQVSAPAVLVTRADPRPQ